MFPKARVPIFFEKQQNNEHGNDIFLKGTWNITIQIKHNIKTKRHMQTMKHNN